MRKLLVLAAVAVVAACARSGTTPTDTTLGQPGGATPTDARGQPQATQPPVGTAAAVSPPKAEEAFWQASFGSRNGADVTATADIRPAPGGHDFVMLAVSGGKAGDVYAWHVHSGTCATGGGVVGSASDYRPDTVMNSRTRMEVAQLGVYLDPTQKYHIDIHRSPTDTVTILACGDLSVSR